MQKKVSVVIPCYNEQENVRPICLAIKDEFEKSLPQYLYEILLIDNKSKDETRSIIREICEEDAHVKAIFNLKNFGQFNSPYYAMCQTTGDCVITICADFQDPIEMIPKFISEWENGHRVVCAIKTTSKESSIMYFLRSCYYKTLKKMSEVEQIEHFTGFGLYDKSFIDIMRNLDDTMPFLRGIVAEYAPDHFDIPYEQQKRRAGKTHNNWYTLYDAAMLSFTSYTKLGLRLAIFFGGVFSVCGLLVALLYMLMKLIFWDRFSAGQAPLLIGVFLIGSIQLFFIGLLGEYIMNINHRVIRRPLVIEEERIGFSKQKEMSA